MDCEEEGHSPSKPIVGGLRRSKRIIASDKKKSPSKFAKMSDGKPMKKSATKPKSTRGKKPTHEQKQKSEQPSDTFDGSYLTPEELQILFIKFKRDGHFYVTSPNVSPPPFVISRTTDGKCVTTKIECYEPFTPQTTESEVFRVKSDKTSVTFSTPLMEDSALNFIPPATNPGQSIAPKDKQPNVDPKELFLLKNRNSGQNSTGNRIQKSENSLPNPYVYTGAENRLNNSAVPNIHSQYSAAGNSQANRFEGTSGLTDFSYSNSTRQTIPVRSNSIYATGSTSTWIPLDHSGQDNKKNSNTRRIHFPENAHYQNALGSDETNITSRRNSKENRCGNFYGQSLSNPYNLSNHNEAQGRSPSYQQRQTNAQNSTFPLQNSTVLPQTSTFPFQNSTVSERIQQRQTNGQNSTVSIQNSTLPLQNLSFPLQNSSFPLQNTIYPGQNSSFPLQNTIYPGQNSKFPLQNSTLSPKNSLKTVKQWNAANTSAMTNDAIGFRPGNAMSNPLPQSMNSEYHSSWTPFNNNEGFLNSYISPPIPPQYSYYNASNAQEKCETVKRDVVDNHSCAESQINSWSQNDQPEKNFLRRNDDSMRNNNNIFTITSSDDKELFEGTTFAIGGLEDPQQSGLGPIVSSSCYEDNMSYNDYMGGDVSYSNATLEEGTQKNKNSSKLPSIMTIKTEMKSWYDRSNPYFGNIDQSNGVGRSDLNSFESKSNVVDSSDCYVIEEPSKS